MQTYYVSSNSYQTDTGKVLDNLTWKYFLLKKFLHFSSWLHLRGQVLFLRKDLLSLNGALNLQYFAYMLSSGRWDIWLDNPSKFKIVLLQIDFTWKVKFHFWCLLSKFILLSMVLQWGEGGTWWATLLIIKIQQSVELRVRKHCGYLHDRHFFLEFW